MRTHGSAQELERRRRRAVALVQGGMTPKQAATRIGCSVTSINRWLDSYKRGGPAALSGRPHPGASCRLSDAQRRDLVGRLTRGALAEGYATDVWTCPRIVEVIRKHYGVTYHVDHIPRFMATLGFSCQKPERRAAQRDEAAIRRWIGKDWPRIKKNRRG